MTVVLHIILIAFLVVLALIGLVLLTPFRLRLKGGRETGVGYIDGYAGVPLRILGVRVFWSDSANGYAIYLLGIPVWRKPIPFEKLGKKSPKRASGKERSKDNHPKTEKKAKEKKSAVDSIGDMFYLLDTPNVRVVLARLFRLLNPRGELDLVVGFDDPSVTGIAAGLISFMSGNAPGVQSRIQYNFTEADLRGRFLVGMTVWIPQLIVGAAVIALSKPGRALIAHLWGFRKRRAARAA